MHHNYKISTCEPLKYKMGYSILMWMMPLHLHVNQKSDYDVMTIQNQYAWETPSE